MSSKELENGAEYIIPGYFRLENETENIHFTESGIKTLEKRCVFDWILFNVMALHQEKMLDFRTITDISRLLYARLTDPALTRKSQNQEKISHFKIC